MNNPSRDIWILQLIPPHRFARALFATATFAVLISIYATAGIFGERPTNAAPANAAVFFAVILAYIVPIFHLIVARSEEAFDDLVPFMDAPAQSIAAWRRSIRTRTQGSQLRLAALGLAAGLAHNLALTSPVGLWRVFSTSPADAAVICGTMLVWLFMTTVIFGLIENARVFARLASHVRIDLLQPRALTPFARVAVISTLAIIGAQAAFPILWITEGALNPLASIPGLIATAIPMVFLFAMPILPIHRAMVEIKTTELQRLDAEVASQQGNAGQREVLLPLLLYRREIEATREWPFDTSVASRLALYLVIPPFTWVGAAVIQHFVEGAL